MTPIHKESLTDISSITETLVDGVSETASTTVGPFPSTFTVYFKKAFLPFAYYIASGNSFQQKAPEPLMGIAINWGVLGKPLLTLYEAFDKNSPALGVVRYSGVLGKHSMIELSSGGDPEGLDIDSKDSHLELKSEKVQLRSHFGLPTCRFEFSVAVPSAHGDVLEKFEWRGSKGEQVKGLEAWRFGWKLVRLGAGHASTPSDDECATETSSNLKDDKRLDYVKENGNAADKGEHEVVAAAAFHGKLSLSKLAKFKFLGSAERGALGERWATMAVVSFLRVMQIHTEGR